MIIRALDSDGDWTFGAGKNNYKKDQHAVAQLVKTRLASLLGDCFFALTDGIDWYNLLGEKSVPNIKLAVNTTILNTEGISGLLAVSSDLDENRVITLEYQAMTIYGQLMDTFQFDAGQI